MADARPGSVSGSATGRNRLTPKSRNHAVSRAPGRTPGARSAAGTRPSPRSSVSRLRKSFPSRSAIARPHLDGAQPRDLRHLRRLGLRRAVEAADEQVDELPLEQVGPDRLRRRHGCRQGRDGSGCPTPRRSGARPRRGDLRPGAGGRSSCSPRARPSGTFTGARRCSRHSPVRVEEKDGKRPVPEVRADAPPACRTRRSCGPCHFSTRITDFARVVHGQRPRGHPARRLRRGFFGRPEASCADSQARLTLFGQNRGKFRRRAGDAAQGSAGYRGGAG